jgi:hypothetical protein
MIFVILLSSFTGRNHLRVECAIELFSVLCNFSIERISHLTLFILYSKRTFFCPRYKKYQFIMFNDTTGFGKAANVEF